MAPRPRRASTLLPWRSTLSMLAAVGAMATTSTGCSAGREATGGAGGTGSGSTVTGFETGSSTTQASTGSGPFDGCKNVDVLFVIDDSGSMGDKQAALAQAFPAFVDTMKQKLAMAVSYHVGVVTSDDYFSNVAGCTEIGDLVVKTGGPESSNAACGPFGGGRHYLDGTDADLETAFQCIAKVGAGGSDDERVMRGLLNAVQPARNAPGGCNEGFARADSLLIVVLIADEDDAPDTSCDPLMDPFCAQGSGGTSTDWFDELVGYRGGVADNVVVLSLVNKGTCAGSIGARETGFTLKFKHGVVGDVCSLDYATFFADALPVIGTACEQYTPPS